jgi:phospholipid N-methyltransferase
VTTGRNRLLKLREETEAAGVQMVFDRSRFDSLADPSNKSRAVSAFNLFQTPEAIADQMVSMLTLSDDMTVLEPSAGIGRIYTALRRAGHAGPVVLAENSVDCCRELFNMTDEDKTAIIKQGDFLNMSMRVDAVIMNPPFKMGLDIKHILHAFDCLKPGGLLVSLCYNGVRQNKQLKPLVDSWEVLPAGSFKKEGTNAEIIILTMRKD